MGIVLILLHVEAWVTTFAATDAMVNYVAFDRNDSNVE
jgi:hypothetical protein